MRTENDALPSDYFLSNYASILVSSVVWSAMRSAAGALYETASLFVQGRTSDALCQLHRLSAESSLQRLHITEDSPSKVLTAPSGIQGRFEAEGPSNPANPPLLSVSVAKGQALSPSAKQYFRIADIRRYQKDRGANQGVQNYCQSRSTPNG